MLATEEVPEYLRSDVIQLLNQKVLENKNGESLVDNAYSATDLENKSIEKKIISANADRVLSRQKRQFPVFGFLSFLMLLVNSALLVNENININNNNNNNNNNVS